MDNVHFGGSTRVDEFTNPRQVAGFIQESLRNKPEEANFIGFHSTGEAVETVLSGIGLMRHEIIGRGLMCVVIVDKVEDAETDDLAIVARALDIACMNLAIVSKHSRAEWRNIFLNLAKSPMGIVTEQILSELLKE